MTGIDPEADPRGALWERRLRRPVAALLAAGALLGIGDRIVSGDKHPTPYHGTWDVIRDMSAEGLILTAAAVALAVVATRTAMSRREP